MPPSNQPAFQPQPNQPAPVQMPAIQPGAMMNPGAVPATPQPLPTAGSDAPAAHAPASKQKNPNSTQNALLISEVRDGIVVMNDGSMRAVVSCRSINFDLMSDREQDAAEFSYQQLLNSLYFPIQIHIRSQRVDLGPYLDRLVKASHEQDNMLLSVLMSDYIAFIDELAQQVNIMNKSFFIVVPYYPVGNIDSAVNTSKNFLSNLFASQSQQHIRIDEKAYAKGQEELNNRVNALTNGLAQMTIRSARLNTKELGELYYSAYNPDTAVRQPLGNFENLTAPAVTKGQGPAPQPHLNPEVF